MTIILITLSLNQFYEGPDFYSLWKAGFYLLVTICIYLIYQVNANKISGLLKGIVHSMKSSKGNINRISGTSIKKFRLEIIQWEHGGIQLGCNVGDDMDIDELGSTLYTALYTLQKKDPTLHRMLLFYTLETLSRRSETVNIVREYLDANEEK